VPELAPPWIWAHPLFAATTPRQAISASPANLVVAPAKTPAPARLMSGGTPWREGRGNGRVALLDWRGIRLVACGRASDETSIFRRNLRFFPLLLFSEPFRRVVVIFLAWSAASSTAPTGECP